MILEFKVKNYGSIRDEVVLSLVAESSKSKSENIHEATLAKGETVRLLTSAVIYGANASGKTTVLKAFVDFMMLIIYGWHTDAGDGIIEYNPFIFDKQTIEEATSFELSFIGLKNVKCIYAFSYDKNEIIKEELFYYPKGAKAELISRYNSATIGSRGLFHIGKIRNKHEIKVFKNRLLLATFGKEEPHEVLTDIYIYFKKFKFSNLSLLPIENHTINKVSDFFSNNVQFKSRLNQLILHADLNIKEIVVQKKEKSISNEITSRVQWERFGIHSVFDGKDKMGEQSLPFEKESKGTNVLFNLGGRILEVLQKGEVLFVDELETSLHPNLCKLLIELFHSKEYNPHGAQLIFTTHNVQMLNNTIFRKDQIWLCEKDQYGATDLFSIQDFKTVREDTPFDRWYLAGKFGALPKITFPKFEMDEPF